MCSQIFIVTAHCIGLVRNVECDVIHTIKSDNCIKLLGVGGINGINFFLLYI
jgi:hypothetical protein